MKLEDVTFVENCTHWVVFFEDRGGEMYLHHMVGFHEHPSQENIDLVTEEVENDPEFGLGEFAKTLTAKVLPAGPEIDEMLSIMNAE